MHNMDENEVLRDALSGLKDEVPPMPEGLHAAWMQKVEADMNEKRTEQLRSRRSFTRFLSVAAAMVFVVGGTLLTRDDLSPRDENGANAKSSVTGSLSAYSYTADAESAEAEAYDAGTPMLAMTRGAGNSVSEESSVARALTEEKKIIRTASLTIATQTFEDSLESLRSSCEGQGGWIESSSESVSRSTGLRTAHLTLRIPQDLLDTYLAGTEGLGRITYRSESAQDVTASYQDTQTRLDTQLALMERLQALITESGDLSDLLALESQIAETQYQIDSLQSSLNSTDRQVSYATVSVTLQEEKTVELTDGTVSFGDRLLSAVQVGVETLVGFLGDMAVFLVAALPFIAIVVVMALAVHFIRRRKK